MGVEEGRATKKGSTKKWTEDARDSVGDCGRWSEAAVGRRGEFAGRGRRGASVVRHEKMVIPSRMCPMHMHVFPQNGWPRCGLDEGTGEGEGGSRENEVS